MGEEGEEEDGGGLEEEDHCSQREGPKIEDGVTGSERLATHRHTRSAIPTVPPVLQICSSAIRMVSCASCQGAFCGETV